MPPAYETSLSPPRKEHASFFPPTPRTAFLLIFVLLLVYATSLGSAFVWDDYIVIADNDFVKSWKHFPLLFTKAYLSSIDEVRSGRFRGSGETTYRPLSTATFFFDYRLWRLNPFGYHLGNIVLHAGCTVLVYLFFLATVRERALAFLAALFFGLHPVNAEAVAVVSFREDLLALFFILASLLSHLAFRSGKKWGYCASIFFFLSAVFSKETAIVLPLLIAVYDYFFIFEQKARTLLRHFWSTYAAYLVPVVLYVAVLLYMKGGIGEYAREYPYPGSLYTNFLTMSKVVAVYIGWLFFPVTIHATFPEAEPGLTAQGILSWGVLASLALICLCLLVAFRVRRRAPEISFAIAWFFIALLPVCNVFPIASIIASRYLYMPSVGFALLLAVALRRLSKLRLKAFPQDFLRIFSRDTVLVVAVFYGIFTSIRIASWKNDIVLWQELAAHYPRNPHVYVNLGQRLKREGLFARAVDAYETALKHGLAAASGYDLLGQAYGDRGLYREAERYFRQAIDVDPGFAGAYNNLAVSYARQGRMDEARALWVRVLEMHPDFAEAGENLGKLERMRVPAQEAAPAAK